MLPLGLVQRSGGLAKLGFDCTPFGLSPTVKGRAEVRVTTLTPILPNHLIDARPFYILSRIKSITPTAVSLFFLTILIIPAIIPNIPPKIAETPYFKKSM